MYGEIANYIPNELISFQPQSKIHGVYIIYSVVGNKIKENILRQTKSELSELKKLNEKQVKQGEYGFTGIFHILLYSIRFNSNRKEHSRQYLTLKLKNMEFSHDKSWDCLTNIYSNNLTAMDVQIKFIDFHEKMVSFLNGKYRLNVSVGHDNGDYMDLSSIE